MSCILNIETSTEVCSVAVSQDGANIFHIEDLEGPSHAAKLGTFVDEALSFTDNHAIPFDAVAVSCGPGSYTGLRIGVSMAKGICYARNLHLLAIPTLEILCVPLLLGNEELPEDALLCPMIDARRMEVYSAVYDNALNDVVPVGAYVIDEHTFSDLLDNRRIVFSGNGSTKCKDVIKHRNAIFVEGIVPLATDMLALAERAFRNGQFEDVAYFEPFYLKEFVASLPKKLL